ncbi:MAG TPA: hypothetical protein VNG33_11895 [Polyangiaceae bacterium]|nr:hypothetical protein [Polyangiaceae bacterium]
MTPISLEKSAAALCLSLVMVACGPSNEASRAQSGPIVGPFLVSDVYTPSGFMGDGAIPGRMTVSINSDCKQPRPAGAQGDCYHFIYRVSDVKWAGCDWVYPTNSWGSVPGRTLIGPVDLGKNPDHPEKEMYGYNHVRFSAAVDMNYNPKDPLTAEPLFDSWAGRLDGRTATPPQPYWDTGCSVFPGMPPTVTCTDTSDPLHPVPYAFAPSKTTNSLKNEWQQFSVDLSKWSVDQVIGGFGWAANDSDNPGKTLSLYFDDIVWE